MSDKELLELAARAIGRCLHKNTRSSYGNGGADTTCTDCGKDTYGEGWWPLTNDGDALRLAVKLKLQIHIDNGYGTAARRPDRTWQACEAHKFGGIEAATRRAIVLAAAAIGQKDGAV